MDRVLEMEGLCPVFESPGMKPIRRNDWWFSANGGGVLGSVSSGEGIDSSPESPSDVCGSPSEELNVI